MRKTFVLNKGNYLTPGEEVQAALPASFHRMPAAEAGTARNLNTVAALLRLMQA